MDETTPQSASSGLHDVHEMVRVSAGPFIMGTADHDSRGRDDERSQHTVLLSAFSISKYPVTKVEYQAFIAETGYVYPAFWDDHLYPEEMRDHPVVGVTWDDAVTYCKWLGEKTGKTLSLPTEAQWEKAARGTYGHTYPWGDEWETSHLNNRDGGLSSTSEVGKFSPSGDSSYGVADMAGNVLEWCRDWYREDEYAQRGDDPVLDPEGPETGEYRVLRGGAFNDGRRYVRCAVRHWHFSEIQRYDVGFRVAQLPE